MKTPKSIRRSDGHAVKQQNSGIESDDLLIERTIAALTGEIQKKQEKMSQQPAVNRIGGPLVKQAQRTDSVPIKTWEECKQELVTELLRRSRDHEYNDTEGGIDINTLTRGER